MIKGGMTKIVEFVMSDLSPSCLGVWLWRIDATSKSITVKIVYPLNYIKTSDNKSLVEETHMIF